MIWISVGTLRLSHTTLMFAHLVSMPSRSVWQLESSMMRPGTG